LLSLATSGGLHLLSQFIDKPSNIIATGFYKIRSSNDRARYVAKQSRNLLVIDARQTPWACCPLPHPQMKSWHDLQLMTVVRPYEQYSMGLQCVVVPARSWSDPSTAQLLNGKMNARVLHQVKSFAQA
jgi:hypothetical protein